MKRLRTARKTNERIELFEAVEEEVVVVELFKTVAAAV